ncbi:acetoin utilization deacetylase AcuC-like enzyme [Algoriphagus sp. 4150]|uniref:histone deacetylase family protein n=1 Tax=Algoriphagus sp. 4150 TaxID=2817756 RepID=UPI00285C996D|nr:histone deacetylase [Algoriphagus sp. 4150]MDR7128235.1 acetoin utilization deacetylase AcuC-like enzyme [Algoriphagus sp. 4150]
MLKIAFSPIYKHPLPENHRFPMEKYELLPGQLLYEGVVTEENFFEPTPVSEKWILNTHTREYWNKLKQLTLSKSEVRATGFPLSKELVDREVIIVQGSIQAALYALEYGVAMNIAGGTHHAFADRGEGFCLLNDIAVVANYLIDNQFSKKVLIIDLDVHQGNGTASIFADDPSVFTFSMHGEKNYPMHKEVSDLDCAVADGTGDQEYLAILQSQLELILKKFTPDFIIYQSGVDVLDSDKLGRLSLSLAGVKTRDAIILKLAKSLNVPIMCCMGGGYSSQVSKIVEAHTMVYRLAQELYF